jgi:hypothetical protein
LQFLAINFKYFAINKKELLGVNNMNKKVVIGSICTVFVLLTISLTTTVSSNAIDIDKKESPLWKIRNRRAINEKLGRVIDNIRASFIGDTRIFFIQPILRFLQRDVIILGTRVPSAYCKC